MIPLIEQIYWTVAAVCGGYGLVLLAIALIYHLISAKLELKWLNRGWKETKPRRIQSIITFSALTLVFVALAAMLGIS